MADQKGWIKDSIMYGKGYGMIIYRKWYNPLKYFIGPMKFKKINPQKVIKG